MWEHLQQVISRKGYGSRKGSLTWWVFCYKIENIIIKIIKNNMGILYLIGLFICWKLSTNDFFVRHDYNDPLVFLVVPLILGGALCALEILVILARP